MVVSLSGMEDDAVACGRRGDRVAQAGEPVAAIDDVDVGRNDAVSHGVPPLDAGG